MTLVVGFKGYQTAFVLIYLQQRHSKICLFLSISHKCHNPFFYHIYFFEVWILTTHVAGYSKQSLNYVAMCAVQNNKFKLMQRLEDLKARMEWDQQALQAWLEEAARKDEDAMIIEKYSRQDEAKIKVMKILLWSMFSVK
jgi:hypothetical protein